VPCNRKGLGGNGTFGGDGARGEDHRQGVAPGVVDAKAETREQGDRCAPSERSVADHQHGKFRTQYGHNAGATVASRQVMR
jgi:hypothetical protein